MLLKFDKEIKDKMKQLLLRKINRFIELKIVINIKLKNANLIYA